MARPGTHVLAAALTAVTCAACAGHPVPDPRNAASEYAAAARRGDTHAVFLLLSAEARRTYGEEGTRRLLADAKEEIAGQAEAIARKDAAVRIVAEVPFSDGERSIVDVEGGRYRVSAAAGLPSAPRTPAQALSDLRRALSRRSYAALVRVLSAATRAALEQDLRSLTTGLENPDALDVKIRGDSAEVVVPGGHKVRLSREAGVWRVHDFD